MTKAKQMQVTVMLKDGGYESLQITPEMLGELAQRIVANGSERVITLTQAYEVVGVLIKGNQIGDRVILTSSGEGVGNRGTDQEGA